MTSGHLADVVELLRCAADLANQHVRSASNSGSVVTSNYNQFSRECLFVERQALVINAIDAARAKDADRITWTWRSINEIDREIESRGYQWPL